MVLLLFCIFVLAGLQGVLYPFLRASYLTFLLVVMSIYPQKQEFQEIIFTA